VTRPDADLVDPDADVRVPTPQGERRTTPWPVLAAVSAGGVVGALARHGLQQALPLWPDGFGWVTFGINIFGCLLMGVLMVRITEVWTGNRLLRPFLGVGVLGGFTTFSTYVLEVQQAIGAGAWHTALLYATAPRPARWPRCGSASGSPSGWSGREARFGTGPGGAARRTGPL